MQVTSNAFHPASSPLASSFGPAPSFAQACSFHGSSPQRSADHSHPETGAPKATENQDAKKYVQARRRTGSPQDYVVNTHFNHYATIIFFGGISLNLLIYAMLSPYWFMMHSRAFTHPAELRVLGLTTLVEGTDNVNMLRLDDTNFRTYSLRHRKDRICSRVGVRDEVLLEGDKGHCDLDCQDMRLLGDVKVRCTKDGHHRLTPWKIPYPPPKRLDSLGVREDSNSTEVEKWTDRIDVLEYGCYKKKTRCGAPFGIRCPTGYKCCDKVTRDNHKCTSDDGKKKSWNQATCCLDQDPKKLGQTVFASKPPTYVALYGWAQWKIKLLRDWDDDDTHEMKESRWCSVRDLRCSTLKTFTANGWWCFRCIISAAVLVAVALFISMFAFRQKRVMMVFVMYLSGSTIAFWGVWRYYAHTEATVRRTMTPRDDSGRPYIHPMDQYDTAERTIFQNKNSYEFAEWTYFRLNARVDYATADRFHPTPFVTLWGYHMAEIGGAAAVLACLACADLQLSLRSKSPLLKVLGVICTPLLCIPVCMKKFIDNKVAPYPVLWVYPWQKLYPYAFTAGTKFGCLVDTIWDVVLMTPVHLTRAIWDYVSCQDICSPQEKKVLHEHGIHNDRLQSLLSSRRSYFVAMAVMGVVAFVANLIDMINISNDLATYFRATNLQISYPINRCGHLGGKCSSNEFDANTALKYLEDMSIRLYAIVMEGCNYAETTKQVISWLGTFLSVFCACGALRHWIDFQKSRRFCLVGWLFASLTPIITSSIAEVDMVDWGKAESHIVEVGAEAWEELMFQTATGDCQWYVDLTQQGLDWGKWTCEWHGKLSRLMQIKEVRKACDSFEETYAIFRATAVNNGSSFCHSMGMYMEDGPSFKAQVRERMKRDITPTTLDALRVLVGSRSALKNSLVLVGAIMSMAPALMQGGLMVKNQVPFQTMPSILTTLPWAFCLLFWAQYQLYYQILGGTFFLVACLCLSFGPILYYFFAKHYRVIQPMCDQQSVTFTFRIWYYALVFALVIPYIMMIVYVVWINEFQADLIKDSTIGKLLNPKAKDIVAVISNTLCMYAYTLQAGIDWFVDELVTHHLAAHAPVCLAATQSPEEATVLQRALGTSLDQELIQEGTYVCGGLSDPYRLQKPPTECDWSDKVKVYASCLAYKDYATLDQLAGHLRTDDRLPKVLARARRPYFGMMRNPPHGAFVNDCDSGRVVGKPPTGSQLQVDQRERGGQGPGGGGAGAAAVPMPARMGPAGNTLPSMVPASPSMRPGGEGPPLRTMASMGPPLTLEPLVPSRLGPLQGLGSSSGGLSPHSAASSGAGPGGKQAIVKGKGRGQDNDGNGSDTMGKQDPSSEPEPPKEQKPAQKYGLGDIRSSIAPQSGFVDGGSS